MNKNIAFNPTRSLFLSIEQRETNSSRIAEPILLRRRTTFDSGLGLDDEDDDNESHVYLVAAPQFKRYQDKNTYQQYNLTRRQYDEFGQFFKENSDDGQFIEASFIRCLMLSVLKRKAMVHATKRDVDRALNCFGTFLTIDEFLTFMALFFASDSNLMQRIRCFLVNSNQSCQNEFLMAYEAAHKYEFLKSFYGLNYENDAYLAILNEMTDKRVSVYEFLRVILPCLESAVFVKWKK